MRILFVLLFSLATALPVTLKWDGSVSSDVTGYRLKWSFTQGGPYDHVVEAGMATTATVDEPWPMGSTVYFTAYAYSTAGESLPSNEVAYPVPIPTPTPTPTPSPTPPPPPTPAPTPAPPSNLRLLLNAIAQWWNNLFA